MIFHLHSFPNPAAFLSALHWPCLRHYSVHNLTSSVTATAVESAVLMADEQDAPETGTIALHTENSVDFDDPQKLAGRKQLM